MHMKLRAFLTNVCSQFLYLMWFIVAWHLKNERANLLKEVKSMCKEFGFTAEMLKRPFAEGRKKQCS